VLKSITSKLKKVAGIFDLGTSTHNNKVNETPKVPSHLSKKSGKWKSCGQFWRSIDNVLVSLENENKDNLQLKGMKEMLLDKMEASFANWGVTSN
jgi:hypothetical protein